MSPGPVNVVDLVPCAACEYLVPRASTAGLCPECAHPVAHSVEVASVGLAARRADRRLTMGLILASMAVALLASAALLPPPWARGALPSSIGQWCLTVGILLVPLGAAVVAMAAPAGRIGIRFDRGLAVVAIVLFVATFVIIGGHVVERWRLYGLSSVAGVQALRPRFHNLSPTSRAMIVWIVWSGLLALLCALIRRRGRAPWSAGLGAVAMVLLAFAAAFDWSNRSGSSIARFPENPSWLWLVWQAAFRHEGRLMAEVAAGAGVLLLGLVVVDLVSAIRRRRRRAWVAARAR